MISDRVLHHLQGVIDVPDLSSTRYKLIREIGRGGMGTVYLADDPALGRQIAIKILDESREARIIAKLDHPGVVPVYDAGVLPDGRAYYAMKVVEGERLDKWLPAHTGLLERLRLFMRIAEPVAFAHSRGVAHYDLKPSNIMVGKFGEVLVLDWGTPSAGTADFMAPEQRSGADPDSRADVYAMGRILAVLLELNSPIPNPLRSIQRRATEVNPALRYDGVAAIAADVTAWLDRMPVQAHHESLFERLGRLLAKHRTLAGLLAAYLVMRIVLLFWLKR
jgi:serine/threonine-protein kinase